MTTRAPSVRKSIPPCTESSPVVIWSCSGGTIAAGSSWIRFTGQNGHTFPVYGRKTLATLADKLDRWRQLNSDMQPFHETLAHSRGILHGFVTQEKGWLLLSDRGASDIYLDLGLCAELVQWLRTVTAPEGTPWQLTLLHRPDEPMATLLPDGRTLDLTPIPFGFDPEPRQPPSRLRLGRQQALALRELIFTATNNLDPEGCFTAECGAHRFSLTCEHGVSYTFTITGSGVCIFESPASRVQLATLALALAP